MADGRKKLSGCAYKVLAKEKARRLEQTISKTVKLDNYFNRESPKVVTTVEKTVAKRSDPVLGDPLTDTTPDIPDLSAEYGTSDCGVQLVVPLSKDPSDWVINDLSRDHVVSHGINQNIDGDFTKSARQYGDKSKFMKTSFFAQKLHNGEQKNRSWLVYSEKTTALFCAPCRLFGGTTQFAAEGFSDWKNATARLKHHEQSQGHKSCVIAMRDRSNVLGRIDKTLTIQINEETAYWRNILKRIVAVNAVARDFGSRCDEFACRPLYDFYGVIRKKTHNKS